MEELKDESHNKVLVRALTQFIYTNDKDRLEYIKENREVSTSVTEAIRLKDLDIVDVLNPFLNDDISDEYIKGFEIYQKEVKK